MGFKTDSRSILHGCGIARTAIFTALILFLALLSSCRQVIFFLPPEHSGEITISGAPEGYIEKGQSFQLEVESGAPGSGVTWVSSDTDVATVSPDGVVTAVGPGVAEITAQYNDKVSKPVTVTVSGIAVESHFGTALSENTTSKKITLKAYGDAKITDLAAAPEINPTGAVTITKQTSSTGSVTYEITSVSLTAGESCTIDFGGDTEPFVFTYVEDEVTVNVEGTDVIAGINPDKETVIDLSSAIKDGEELATITVDDKVIYDVNNPEKTEEGYEYNPDDKTLTVPEDIANGIIFDAEKVKVLLFDALLRTDGKNYGRPELNADNLKGKYSKPSEAYKAVSSLRFSKGIYIQLLSDIEEDSIGGRNYITMNQETTIDLSGHSWSKADPKNSASRIIAAIVPGGKTLNVINGKLMNGSLSGDYLGAAIYANNTGAYTTIQNWLAGNKNAWGKVNIFDVAFSDNNSGGGGAICLNGAVELNVYDAEFIGNDTTQNNQKDETGNGAAIYVWNHGNDRDGEIVNLYDCSFSGNKGNGLLSMENNNNEILFNIYGGSFTGNTFRYDYPLMAIYSFNIYGGDFSGETISNDKGFNYDININGGIMGTLEIS